MFFSTVAGSYPRPRWLIDGLIELQGKQKESESKIDSQVEEAFRKATSEVIQEQEEAGITLITDGQLRWNDALAHPAEKIPGFQMGGLIRYYDNNFYYRRPEVTGEVKWAEPILVDDFNFAKTSAKKCAVKSILPGPYTLHKLSANKTSLKGDGLILKLGEIFAREVQELQNAGCKFIQIDEPSLVYEPPISEDEREAVKAALEKIFTTISPGTTSILCTYFSALKEEHTFLLDLKFDVLGIDFISSPEQNLTFLKEQKVEKKLALGLFDARNVREEREEEIKELIDKISQYCNNLNEVYLNPNCGLEFLPRKYALRKLKLISAIVKKLNQE